MGEVTQDRWASWLARRRHGEDPEMLRRTLEYLIPVRDQVLKGAHLETGATALDVGCGDGLIAFAACNEVGACGSVTFSDVSEDLLQQCRELATEAGMIDRSRFERAAAKDLSKIEDVSVDAVTLRSVLIYEPDKSSAFSEFQRVLRPGGWLSLFEPINRFTADAHSEPELILGRDLRAVSELAAKVWAVYEAIQPPDTDPMLNFDERDLVRLAEESGFTHIHLEFSADIEPAQPMPWDAFLNVSGNLRIPTFGEAMDQALTQAESERLTVELRPQVEQGLGEQRSAVAYLTARRN
ncbi:MAG: class I SAM-dependent methyltransferase [Ornithinimicrobium sp.]